MSWERDCIETATPTASAENGNERGDGYDCIVYTLDRHGLARAPMDVTLIAEYIPVSGGQRWYAWGEEGDGARSLHTLLFAPPAAVGWEEEEEEEES